jgi:hypothetical protein
MAVARLTRNLGNNTTVGRSVFYVVRVCDCRKCYTGHQTLADSLDKRRQLMNMGLKFGT